MFVFFFFNDTATTEIYTLSLHDALPICCAPRRATTRTRISAANAAALDPVAMSAVTLVGAPRSEEHTSELQSPCNLVCRLLLEKKNIRPVSRRAEQPAQHRRRTREIITV